ncbi:flagellar basal body P-ring formation chaperone FlgA [Novosphingobium sp. M1R2S20]|uniref:Flagella basal body P-ring formation protein FlgA n=1 Tax=Novosphingobium rhizovicinum TaxID=3228928 RepID=A0ABV3R9I6_9SPHN
MAMLGSILALLAAQAAPATVETPVLARIVERGEIVSSKDFTVEALPSSQARAAVAPKAANGLEATRRLNAGSIVRATDLMTPRLVRRGEPVTIYVRSGGLLISTTGRSLDNGAMGERVRVVANSTNRTLDAEVEGSGAVRTFAH